MEILMLRMCKPIFRTGKTVVVDSGFYVLKVITEIEAKYVYAGSLIVNQHYWLKGVTEDLVDTHFQDEEVGDVYMLKSKTQDKKMFHTFFMKEPDYVMKMMEIWITLYRL